MRILEKRCDEKQMIHRRSLIRGFAGAVVARTFAPWAQIAEASVPSRNAGAFEAMLARLRGPVLFRGNATTAYRDPAAIYHHGWLYLYFTLVVTESDGKAYSYVAWSRSKDLRSWSAPQKITPRDKHLDYGSPGDLLRVGDEWILCLQTYPRPNGEKYGNRDARIWIMKSSDLQTWQTPELIRVKGPNISIADMGRMIDPFLLADKDQKKKWWCFYKQNGISLSSSENLEDWVPFGHTDAGENPCVIVDQDEYVLFHSPPNGIGVKRSSDLREWRDEGLLLLGQTEWAWAQGRLTAGFVLDMRKDARVGKALLFFHGSDYAEADPRGGFDTYASIGIAWSDDLQHWEWPRS
jgi:hypothetical protein